jgi:hypothetical protein
MVYGFRSDRFAIDACGPAIQLLFTAFVELQKLPSTPEFVVWIGTFGDSHWWIGVPACLPQDVTDVLQKHLSTQSSFDAPELGDVPGMGLLPKWKYTSKVIYALAPISGGDDIACDDYGSGLSIEILPCMISDEEG